MTNSDDQTTKPKSRRIGASPASNDWDPGPVADQKLMNSLKSSVVDTPFDEDDPLEEKHKAQAYRRDFRTVDYRKLSETEDQKAAERKRIKAMHSTWTPKPKPGKSAPPSSLAKFASFGGSTISVDVIRLKEGQRSLSGDSQRNAQGEARSALSMPAADGSEERSPKAQFDDAQLSGTVPAGEEPQLLAAPREGSEPDPLTEIGGIGPSLERLLYDLGVFHYEQIAGWTGAQAAWVEASLSCEQGRIEKEDWIGQAIRLRVG